MHVKVVKGKAIVEKFLMNLRKNYTKPINDYTYFTVVGTGHYSTDFILVSDILIPRSLTVSPKNVVVVRKKVHFFSLQ